MPVCVEHPLVLANLACPDRAIPAGNGHTLCSLRAYKRKGHSRGRGEHGAFSLPRRPGSQSQPMREQASKGIQQSDWAAG